MGWSSGPNRYRHDDAYGTLVATAHHEKPLGLENPGFSKLTPSLHFRCKVFANGISWAKSHKKIQLHMHKSSTTYFIMKLSFEYPLFLSALLMSTFVAGTSSRELEAEHHKHIRGSNLDVRSLFRFVSSRSTGMNLILFCCAFLQEDNLALSDASHCERVCIDFSTTGDGSALSHGDYVQGEWLKSHGMTITALATKGGYTQHGKARIFDTSQPGEDSDLGSPNQGCGGPGVGLGGAPSEEGANCIPQGNVLIIQESKKAEPDDNSDGGAIKFYFQCPLRQLLSVGLIDIDVAESAHFELAPFAADCGANQDCIFEQKIKGLGDNSIQVEHFSDAKYLESFSIIASGSFGVSMICFCPGECDGSTAPTPASASTSKPANGDSAPPPPPPPPQVTLSVNISPLSLEELSLEEPGNVTFTVTVANMELKPISVNVLSEDGYLLDELGEQVTDAESDCSTPQTIQPESTYSCTFTLFLSSSFKTTVSAEGEDAEGMPFTVETTVGMVLEIPPLLVAEYNASPPDVPCFGGLTTFDLKINNPSSRTDEVTITSLVDDDFGNLDGQGSCSLPQTIPGNGGIYTCSFTRTVMGIPGQEKQFQYFTSGSDDEGNPISSYSEYASIYVNPTCPEACQGEQGKQGEAGKQGAQGIPGLDGVLGWERKCVINESIRIFQEGTTFTAACPTAGTTILAGGYRFTGPTVIPGVSYPVKVTESFPDTETSWKVVARSEFGSTFVNVEIWVICALANKE